MKSKVGVALLVLLFASYLTVIFLDISNNKTISNDNEKPDYIFYYDEEYVICKPLSDDEMYCLFKDIRTI